MEKSFAILFVIVFAAMLGIGIIAPLMPIFAENLGASGIWLGIIFSGFSLSRTVLTPMVGKASDKLGRKPFIWLGLLAYSAISLAYLYATDVYSLTTIRLAHGAASAMITPVAMAQVGDFSPKGKEGEYMGTFNISLFAGMGSGPFLGGLLNDFLGMSYAFYAMCGLSVFAFILTLLYLGNEEPRQGSASSYSSTSLKAILKDRTLNASSPLG